MIGESRSRSILFGRVGSPAGVHGGTPVRRGYNVRHGHYGAGPVPRPHAHHSVSPRHLPAHRGQPLGATAVPRIAALGDDDRRLDLAPHARSPGAPRRPARRRRRGDDGGAAARPDRPALPGDVDHPRAVRPDRRNRSRAADTAGAASSAMGRRRAPHRPQGCGEMARAGRHGAAGADRVADAAPQGGAGVVRGEGGGLRKHGAAIPAHGRDLGDPLRERRARRRAAPALLPAALGRARRGDRRAVGEGHPRRRPRDRRHRVGCRRRSPGSGSSSSGSRSWASSPRSSSCSASPSSGRSSRWCLA